MKLLKEEMRQRIVEAARDEFFQSGYARASMRAIAQQAGMTVGNIYLYFPGKEQLFDAIVGETVRQIQEITRLPSANNDTIRKMADALRATFVQNRVEFMILVTRSSGSKYENYKQMLITLAQRRMREEFVARGYEALYDPLAVAIMEGLMEIFRTYDGDEKRLEQSLVCFLNYMLGGLLPPGSN
ncbi:MAG TPA: TetR/AcrR family transcriptional regulator [Candidatus Avichristensenella intestinipullorum]|uniref:TetR/AcrR family transcriptional regulator n=1 Tax=Candidatus Avichristensenella intestinipullorum TaxID=2840693 RepID=A0A9D1CJ23_9FIRM|nr:TetR/AcrR family transcriptional regulator [Candidatus Avichristensenella intestinipullorum]